jgi:HK97 family phage prohead protease
MALATSPSPTSTRTFTADFEVRELTGNPSDGYEFSGYAAVYDTLSQKLFDYELGYFYERLNPGAFKQVIASKPDVKLLVNHDASLLLASTRGGTMQLTADQKGLLVSANLAPTTLGQDMRILLRRGDISQMSFAFCVAPDGERVADSPQLGLPIRTITKVSELSDVSIVTYPAYVATEASCRSICGHNFFSEDDDLKIDELRNLAWQIHKGEIEARDSDKSMIDALLMKTPHVSPWMAEQVTRAIAADTDLQAAIQSQSDDVRSDGTTGEPDTASVLAAYDLRLRLAQITKRA